jgi:hypothetical protein
MPRIFLTFLSTLFALGVIGATAPGALAAGAACDVNACTTYCAKRNPQGGLSNYCTRNCLITIDQNKKAGKCK